MADSDESSNLPAQIGSALTGIPKALVPTCIKALDRLVGAAIDIPVAWLGQWKAKIEAQTEAYSLVETSIGKAAASLAEADHDTVQRAARVLIRKAYRKQVNREAVASAMLDDLTSVLTDSQAMADQPSPELDEDWLNVFERYAEDASTDRMQKLWGRVLAGEIRKPGQYSMRTLRFLSEFSQADGLTFAEFSNDAFGDIAPYSLVKSDTKKDIRALIYLESSGLIQGASSSGFTHNMPFDANGIAIIKEGNIVLWFQGTANEKITTHVCALTPLGQELLGLLPGRNARNAARKVGLAMRSPAIKAAYIGTVSGNGSILPMEVLWQAELEA
jgi:Protein of unknown function (DUF2806)